MQDKGEDISSPVTRIQAAENIDLPLLSISAQVAFGAKYPTQLGPSFIMFNFGPQIDQLCNAYLTLFGSQTTIEDLRRDEQFTPCPNTYHQEGLDDFWEVDIPTDIQGVKFHISERRDDKPAVWLSLRFGKAAQKAIALSNVSLPAIEIDQPTSAYLE